MLSAVPALAQQEMGRPKGVTPAPQSAQQGKTPTAPDTGAKNAEVRNLTGWPVYSYDGKHLSNVTTMTRADSGDLGAILFDVGGFLGLGGKTVKVRRDQYVIGADRVELSLSAEKVNELPEADVRDVK